MTSYKRIGAVQTTQRIIHFLAGQKEPIAGKAIADALGIAHGTVMCYLASLEDCQYISSIADKYELGQGLAYVWARYKSKVEGKINILSDELHKLEVK